MASAKPDKSAALDHVAVVMFENRSFDNLLRHLYQPGEEYQHVNMQLFGLIDPPANRGKLAHMIAPFGISETPVWRLLVDRTLRQLSPDRVRSIAWYI